MALEPVQHLLPAVLGGLLAKAGTVVGVKGVGQVSRVGGVEREVRVELDPAKPGELVPGLAESWSVDEDGVTYRFKMRPGVTFSSGNPVTAEAAAQWLLRLEQTRYAPQPGATLGQLRREFARLPWPTAQSRGTGTP